MSDEFRKKLLSELSSSGKLSDALKTELLTTLQPERSLRKQALVDRLLAGFKSSRSGLFGFARAPFRIAQPRIPLRHNRLHPPPNFQTLASATSSSGFNYAAPTQPVFGPALLPVSSPGFDGITLHTSSA